MRIRNVPLIDAFALLLVLLSVAGLFAIAVLWTLGHKPGGVNWDLQSLGTAHIIIASDSSRLVLGIYDADDTQVIRWRWGRRRTNALDALSSDSSFFASAGIASWGVVLPHVVLAAVCCIAPAWWLLVWRERAEARRRQILGLCRHCGFDIRHSSEICPECGGRISAAALRTMPITLASAASKSARP